MRNRVAVFSLCAALAGTAGASGNAANRFEIRGMKGLFWEGIENYYKAVPWMADHHMNWLMLCYSSFPESARDWRKDYTAGHLAQMKELVTRANDKGVTVCLSFNPGIWSDPPLCHSCEADYQTAWRKVVAAHDIGILEIALCLDDIAKKLVPEDVDKYGTLQAAQVAFANRMWKDMQALDTRMRLIFCPSAYTTAEMKAHLDYTKYVGENLAKDIEIFWTGPEVCSPTITVADAQEAEALFQRKPFVWDNYPVNDMFPWRPLLAPVKGRDPALPGAISGILFNPMKQWDLNRIPMISVANYLNDPAGYDESKERARIPSEFPDEDREAVKLLLKYYGSSFWGDDNFPPGVNMNSRSAAKQAADDLRHLKELMLEEGSSLEAMWEDINTTVENDIKNADMLQEGPVVYGRSFEGGAQELAEKAFGGGAALVYAQPTGNSVTSATLNVSELDETPTRLRLMARQSDRVPATVRVTVNGNVVAEKKLEVSDKDFSVIEMPLPSGVVNGHQPVSLQVECVNESGSLGMPPWFAVRWAQVLP